MEWRRNWSCKRLTEESTSRGWEGGRGGAEELPLNWLINGHRADISQLFLDTNNEQHLDLEKANRG